VQLEWSALSNQLTRAGFGPLTFSSIASADAESEKQRSPQPELASVCSMFFKASGQSEASCSRTWQPHHQSQCCLKCAFSLAPPHHLDSSLLSWQWLHPACSTFNAVRPGCGHENLPINVRPYHLVAAVESTVAAMAG
jgi:hypothetical protein